MRLTKRPPQLGSFFIREDRPSRDSTARAYIHDWSILRNENPTSIAAPEVS